MLEYFILMLIYSPYFYSQPSFLPYILCRQTLKVACPLVVASVTFPCESYMQFNAFLIVKTYPCLTQEHRFGGEIQACLSLSKHGRSHRRSFFTTSLDTRFFWTNLITHGTQLTAVVDKLKPESAIMPERKRRSFGQFRVR